jgi:predicted RNase H-like HicB family nuclease
MQLTALLQKAGRFYVALCLELNVASQGESIEDARKMLQDACDEYLAYLKEQKLEHEIQLAPPDVLREFILEDVEQVPDLLTALKLPKYAKTTVQEFEQERKELAEEVVDR